MYGLRGIEELWYYDLYIYTLWPGSKKKFCLTYRTTHVDIYTLCLYIEF